MAPDDKRTYAPGDMFKYYNTHRMRKANIFTKYVITWAGANTIYVIGNNNANTYWIIENVKDINAITWNELKTAIGKHFDRMENHKQQLT